MLIDVCKSVIAHRATNVTSQQVRNPTDATNVAFQQVCNPTAATSVTFQQVGVQPLQDDV